MVREVREPTRGGVDLHAIGRLAHASQMHAVGLSSNEHVESGAVVQTALQLFQLACDGMRRCLDTERSSMPDADCSARGRADRGDSIACDLCERTRAAFGSAIELVE